MSQHVGMSSCCLSGKVHEGKTAGRIDEIGGLSTYVSEPSNGSKAKTIIFITDSKHSLLSLALGRKLHLSQLISSSLWLGIPKHPSPSRRIRQIRLLHIRPRFPPRRLSPPLPPSKHRTPSQNPRESQLDRQSQECRHRPRHARSMAREASRGCLAPHHRRIRQHCPHDPRHEQDRSNWLLLGWALCHSAGTRTGEDGRREQYWRG